MATITISVQSMLNSALYDSYTVSDGITAGALKTTIQTDTGVETAWYVLYYNDVEMVNGNTLASYGVTDGSVLISANTIATLTTKQDRQVAKLNLATLNRTASGNPYNVYDILLLPTQYVGNVVVDNPHPFGLIEGRPWVI